MSAASRVMMFPFHASEYSLFFSIRYIQFSFSINFEQKTWCTITTILCFLFFYPFIDHILCHTQAPFYHYPELLYNTYQGAKHSKVVPGGDGFLRLALCFLQGYWDLCLFSSLYACFLLLLFSIRFQHHGLATTRDGADGGAVLSSQNKERKATGKAMLLVWHWTGFCIF